MTYKITALLISILLLFAVNANAQWTTVCATGNGFVDDLENFNGELYATGFFNTICGTSCDHVAKYDGTTWQAVGNGFPNAGHALATIDGLLYGVAYQPEIDSNWVYQFDGTDFIKLGEGTYLTTAVAGFSQTNNLYNVIGYDNSIVACGEFDRVGSKHISGIMIWNGTEWDSLGSGLSGNINGTAPVMYPHDLCVYDTDLIVSGNFQSAGGQTVNGIARWDGTEWHAMGQGFNSVVYAVGVYNGELYAGGDFTMSGTTHINYIAKWDGTDWIDPGFSFFYSNTLGYTFIHTLKELDNRLVIAGGFDRAVFGSDTMSCQAVVAYNGTSMDTLSGGVVGNEAEGLAMYDGALFVGGGPTNASSFVASYSFATGIDEMDAFGSTISVFPNPTSASITLQSEVPLSYASVTDLMGRVIQPLHPTGIEWHADVGDLPDGMYLVEMMTADGRRGVRKVLKQ